MPSEEIPKDFDLTYQWGLFCERSGLPENKMPPDQKREMKRAFIGACGQMLILLRDELGDYGDKYGEEAASEILQKMLDQVASFWEREMQKQQGKAN